ncbi:LLM class flavin-dependent oxidoreductase [Streptomyces sp. NPDC054884]|uniref:LLM class flavin-dependent oxidoreductase n=1 Tax=Streptomyces sp. ME08-AFT2 TaxID=3028683 RepID=UPI0029BBA9B4|nr:LLM class flavin-dependent oxidoreductase [Streptomyces sp. ME08-AFT2]MDX3312431.1 LLM class flavin-dependent oxidoreductase [Streptomyces sp. ME08-AFT2]
MVHVYSVTPPSAGSGDPAQDYRNQVTAAARHSEQAGRRGILIPHNLHEVDPWPLAVHVGAVTDSLVPLIALQPASVPPHTAAAMAASYAVLYGRPLYFNLVAGARDDELRMTGDMLGHDERYARMRVYGRVLRALLRGETVDLESDWYTYRQFRLTPCPEVLARCKVFVAGSSEAGRAVAGEIADVVVTHPAPYEDWVREFRTPLLDSGYGGELGIRVGIIARPERAAAWAAARERFPETWQGRQETLLKTVSRNSWSRQLAVRAVDESEAPAGGEDADPYWLGAFRSGQASAPFLVGSHEDVADRLGAYLGAGVRHVLLNGSTPDDSGGIAEVLRALRGQVGSAGPR